MAILAWLFGKIGAGIVGVFGAQVLQPILNSINTKVDAQRDITLAGTEADKASDLARVQAYVDANRYRGAQQASFWPIIYLIALPPAIHAGAVYFDSIPLWLPFLGQHVVGSWGVALPPGDYAKMQTDVLTSFFYVAPAVTAVHVIGNAIARR